MSAHVLKTDSDIGAVLHIYPDDDPIVNESSNLFFEVKDKSGTFSWSTCVCKMHILLDGKEEYVGPVGQSGSSYIFPKKGIYQVQLSGESPEFLLSYDVRVSREIGKSEQQAISLWQRIVEWLKQLFRR